jgi:hypothetical protein
MPTAALVIGFCEPTLFLGREFDAGDVPGKASRHSCVSGIVVRAAGLGANVAVNGHVRFLLDCRCAASRSDPKEPRCSKTAKGELDGIDIVESAGSQI